MERDNLNEQKSLFVRTVLLGITICALFGAVVFLYLRSAPTNKDNDISFHEKVVEKTERIAAQSIVHKFMISRIEKDSMRAFQYLTERAIVSLEQDEQSRVGLVNNFERYEIIDVKELEDGAFQFMIKVFEGEIFFIEQLRVIKVLDSYFIDSIELAG